MKEGIERWETLWRNWRSPMPGSPIPKSKVILSMVPAPTVDLTHTHSPPLSFSLSLSFSSSFVPLLGDSRKTLLKLQPLPGPLGAKELLGIRET